MNEPRKHPRLLGFAACLALVGLLIGLPAVLLTLGWGQLPTTWASWITWLTSPDDGRLVVTVLKVAAWVTWALLTFSILTELVAHLRGLSAPRLPGLGWSQRSARRLIATAALLFVALPTVSGTAASATPATHAPSTTSTSTTTPSHTPRTPVARPLAATKPSAHKASPTSYTVRLGDSLWSIAEDHLGSGDRYVEIAKLNAELLHGHNDFLRPGWKLALPTTASNAHARTYTVKTGDNLSTIAGDQLGDAERWPEIYSASRDTLQPGGAHLADPDLILPGWKLTMPTSQSAPTATPAKTTTAGSQAVPGTTTADAPAPSSPAQATPSPVATSAPASAATNTPGSAESTTQALPSTEENQAEAAEQAAPVSWLLAGLSGAGVLLSGALFLVLQRRRQAQFRARRPGRTIAAPPAEVAPVEKTITSMGSQAASSVAAIDLTLRRLAVALAEENDTVPGLETLKVDRGNITVRFDRAVTLPGPWRPSPDPERWCTALTDEPPQREVRAPYPQLVTIGTDDDDATWMIDLERHGSVSLLGDPVFAGDLARYLAAEIGLNPWSSDVHLDCLGVAGELASLDRRRIHHEPLSATLDAHERLLARAAAHAAETSSRCEDLGVDAASGRVTDAGGDLWMSRLILVHAQVQTPQLDQLLARVTDGEDTAGTAVVIVGEDGPVRGTGIVLTSNGRVQVPALGLDLVAVGLTPDEAAGCALLLGHADTMNDESIPADGEDGWRASSDAAGALRSDLVLARDTDEAALDEPATTVLPGADDSIVGVSAATAEDLQQLAPLVPAHVRERVTADDPALGTDLGDWLAPDCSRPRLSLLGPIHARVGSTGNPQATAKRRPFFTEMMAFLALHPDGVTADQLVDAFGGTPSQMRKYISALRDWLGSDPTTGERYLPDANHSPAAKVRGSGVYQLVGVLVDLDLFRRLRLRGESGGAEGVEDLCTALELVSGEPFSGQRELGWAWLADGIRVDHHMVCAIVDVAHLVTTAALVRGDLAMARAATATAIAAAPYEDTPQLDLAAITAAEGDSKAADRLLTENVVNRSVDGEAPVELPPRTRQIIASRSGWGKGNSDEEVA